VGYALGVDLGTTYTAAAICRDGRAEIATLGSRTAAIPSVVHVHNGNVLVGEAAERRAASEPDRVAREFKRRVGDTTPIFLGGSPYSAEALMSHLLRWTVDEVSRTEGGPPDQVAVSYPANWGPYKRELLDNAIRQANLDHAETLTEPECAAIHYASTERVSVGDVVAVYDLGGGTFDAAVLRKTAEGWETLGSPEGIERLGGIDFDAAVFAHVQRSLGDVMSGLDEDDENAMAAVGRLRNECVQAKEALSSDTDASIPVLLPNLQTQVRLTRGEFEDMIRPQIASTIDALRRAIASAGVEESAVKTVLLVGGSSRIPLVAQMITEALGRPVNVDAHPKHSIALGAALAVAPEHRDKALAAAAPTEPPARAPRAVIGAGAAAVGAGAAAAAADAGEPTVPATQVGAAGAAPPGPGEAFGAGGGGGDEGPPARGADGDGRDGGRFARKALVAGATALGVGLLIGGGVVLATSGGNNEPTVETTTSSSSTTTTTTSPPITRPPNTTRPSTTTSTSTTSTTPTTTPPTT
jgi:molecular chaperone DnaK